MSGRSTTATAIRPAEIKDARAVAELVTELGYPTSAADMEKRFRSILPNFAYTPLVAVSDGSVCGFIGTVLYLSYEHNDASGYVIALIVSSTMRGRGIGRQLVGAAEKSLIRKGITRLAVNARLTRIETHKFYEALGFERNGYRFVKQLA